MTGCWFAADKKFLYWSAFIIFVATKVIQTFILQNKNDD